MDMKQVQKQGRDEKTQEDYLTSDVYFCRCSKGAGTVGQCLPPAFPAMVKNWKQKAE